VAVPLVSKAAGASTFNAQLANWPVAEPSMRTSRRHVAHDRTGTCTPNASEPYSCTVTRVWRPAAPYRMFAGEPPLSKTLGRRKRNDAAVSGLMLTLVSAAPHVVHRPVPAPAVKEIAQRPETSPAVNVMLTRA
jgi:hypothetical protein